MVFGLNYWVRYGRLVLFLGLLSGLRLVIGLIKKQILLRREHEKVVRLMRELEGEYIKRRGWWGKNIEVYVNT